jgi:hypothetical protein
MALRLIQFLAIMLTALALVPSVAHLAALPNKVAMAQAASFVAQKIYAGWALFGIVPFGALIANLAHAIVLRKLGRYSAMRSPHFCLLLPTSPSSSSGPSRQIKRPTTGPLCLRTGMRCASNGNIRTLQHGRDLCGLGLCGYCGASTAFASETYRASIFGAGTCLGVSRSA